MRTIIEPSFLIRRLVGGGDPFYLKFWINWPPVGAKSLIFNRSSLVAPQPQHLAKSSRKSTMRFPMHYSVRRLAVAV